ncbi:hypothetical protein M378DRAFT_10667 [Amanita muscaria Koide BX008]|uniref:Xylanolytic transcriptional activator regulatory domain-containing protein n=1 Tax=Amanita muscaria (strain Koide BX008) TaxID=946122 RepID=A0A0C2X8C0_AMAMK|nr:hypothetical protein M378DRAFT_10667 [Amanita muscaria Koide BX008]
MHYIAIALKRVAPPYVQMVCFVIYGPTLEFNRQFLGSLTTGRGNRFVLANTEALHDKINELANRVRQLEDALQTSHALNSSEIHTLLTPELLQIKRPLERDKVEQTQAKEERSEDALDAMGSLLISHNGRGNFFGQTANSWYLLKNEEGSSEEGESPDYESLMPTDIPWLQHAFPFAILAASAADRHRATLLEYLPNKMLAQHLSRIYFRHGAWMYTPISEEDFFDNVFEPIYDADHPVRDASISYRLAALFMVLALGAFLDLDRPPHSPEAMQYYQFGRAALSLESVLEEQSIAAVQALFLMCHFMFLSEMGPSRWVATGIAVKLALSIGLHRDSGRWHIDSGETQKRRELFHELFTYDYWQSLTFGRPPSFMPAHIDCKYPFDSVEDEKGQLEMSFRTWKHRYSAQCMSQVINEAFISARPPKYKLIQELDKKARNWYVPPSLQIPGYVASRNGGEPENCGVEVTMQRFTAFAIKEMTLFYMHRGFFAQALEDNPVDPMASKYAESVLAAYRGACTFVGVIESLFNQHQALLERMWFFFTHVFSCALVLGTIAAKPRMSLAPSALVHLDSAINLFSRVTDPARKAKIIPILQRLREKARTSLLSVKQPPPSDGISPKSELDESYALGGMTRLVSRKSTSPRSSQAGSLSPVSQPASPNNMSQHTALFQPEFMPPPLQHAQPELQHFGLPSWSTPSQNDIAEANGFHQPHYITSPTQHHAQYSFGNAHQNVSQSAPYDAMSEYYGYTQTTDDFGNPTQMMTLENSGPDVAMSWQNFMAQYR